MALQMHVSTKKYIIKGGFQVFKYLLILIYVGTIFLYLLQITSYLTTGKITIYRFSFETAHGSPTSLKKLLKCYILISLKMENL